jgi:hypothetical protein
MQLLEEYVSSYGSGDEKIITFPIEPIILLCRLNKTVDSQTCRYELIKIDVVQNQEGQPSYFKVAIHHPIKNIFTSNYLSNSSSFWNLHSLFWYKLVSWEEWPLFLSNILHGENRKVLIDPLELKFGFIEVFFHVAEKWMIEHVSSQIIANFAKLFVDKDNIDKYAVREFESFLDCSVDTYLPNVLSQFTNNYCLNIGPPSWIKKAFKK